MCCKIIREKDKPPIVVDSFSGKRFPPDEEEFILYIVPIFARLQEEARKAQGKAQMN